MKPFGKLFLYVIPAKAGIYTNRFRGKPGMTLAVFTIILALLSALKYFWFLPQFPFDADQEYLALKSAEILAGKFTLLGAPTSIGGMFIGPLYNYFAAAAMFVFKGNPLVINGLSALWAILTIVTLFWAGKRLFNRNTGIFTAIIGLASSKFLDIANIPPLVIPMTLITLALIYAAKFPGSPRRNLLIGILIGLSLNLHFSGIFFLPFLMAVGVSGLIGVLVSVAPLIAFELKHNFFITKNIVSFLSPPAGAAAPTTLYYRLIVFINSLSELIRLPTGPILEILAKVITVTILVISFKLVKNRVLLTCLYLPLVFFFLYPGHLLPYYAAISWGPFLLISGNAIAKIWGKYRRLRPIVAVALLVFTGFQFLSWSHPSTGHGLDKKLATLHYIKRAAGNQPFYLSKTMLPTADFGYTYLIKYLDIRPALKPIHPTYTLVSPFNWHQIQPEVKFGDIGIVLPKPVRPKDSI